MPFKIEELKAKRFTGEGEGKGYDIIVGTTAEVTAKVATNEINDFAADVLDGYSVLILDGTHTISGSNIVITEDDVSIVGESSEAIVAFSTFTFTMSGARPNIQGLRVSGAAVEDLIITGADAVIDVRGLGGALDDTAGTVRVTNGMRYVTNTLTANRIKTLDSGAVMQGDRISFFNADAAESLILEADDSLSWLTLGPSERVELEALVDAPTDGTDWTKIDGTERIRIFQELTQTFIADNSTETIDLGTDDGLVNSVAGEYDKAFYLSTTVTLPAGWTATTRYYIVNITATTAQLSLVPGGSVEAITDNGTGTHTITPQWIVPLGIHRVHQIVIGGGASGGSGSGDGAANIASGGGGGGSGGGASGHEAVTPVDTLPIGIGVGGAPASATADGVDGNDGNDGADTTFNGYTGDAGHFGGAAVQTTPHPGFGGRAGQSSVGDFNLYGGDGDTGTAGVAASLRAAGGSGGDTTYGVGGRGGEGSIGIDAAGIGAGSGGGGVQEGSTSGASGTPADGGVIIMY